MLPFTCRIAKYALIGLYLFCLIPSSFAQQLSTISPNSVAAGGPDFALTANGSGFVNGSSILWNGFSIPTDFVSSSQVAAVVPASFIAASGTASVAVQNPGGSTSNALSISIGQQSSGTPALSTLSPSSATPGGAAFTLTVLGANFTVGAAVLWNGGALSTSFVNGSQLTAFVPASLIASQGSAIVTVQNPGGGVSSGLTFLIGQQTSGAPTITSLSPGSAAPGGAAFTLTVFGANFVSGAAVLWEGSALSTTFVNGSQLTAFVPAGLIASQGNPTVNVLNPGGAISNGISFVVGQQSSGAPVVSTLSPTSATQGSAAFTLVVVGANFTLGSAVLWNGSALSTTFVNGAQLTAFVPASLIASQGSALVTVLNPGGAISNGLSFIINQQTFGTPTISTISPSSVTVGGAAFTLTIFGTNLISGTTVQWNSSPLSTTFQSTTQLTASVPAFLIASAGNANIRVVNPSGLASNTIVLPITSANSWRIAQIADGGNWKTLFQVINLDQVPVSFSFQFFDDNGSPLQLPFLNGQTGTFAGTLGVGGTAFTETPGTAAALSQGWAKVTGTGRIGVLAIFRQSVPGRPDSEGSISGAPSGSRVFLPFNNTNGFVTGVAIANANPTQALSISMTFQADSGATSSGFISLPPNAHTTFVLTTMFPGLAGQRGSVLLTATTPDIVVTGLRFSPTNSFTSLESFQ